LPINLCECAGPQGLIELPIVAAPVLVLIHPENPAADFVLDSPHAPRVLVQDLRQLFGRRVAQGEALQGRPWRRGRLLAFITIVLLPLLEFPVVVVPGFLPLLLCRLPRRAALLVLAVERPCDRGQRR